MKIEEFEKIKKELLEEKEKNNKQIEKNEKRMKIASANSLENKLLSISGLSAIGYLFFFLTFSEITKVGLTIFNNIIQTLSFPIIIIGSSLCFGTLMNHCISKGLKIKEKYKSFSNAKTEAEKLKEKIQYQIELEKANNRNKTIEETLTIVESYQTMASQYDLNTKTTHQSKEETEKKAQELSNIIKEQYNKLDILTTQKNLHNNFWRIRSKFEKITNIIMVSMIAGLFNMLLITFPLVVIKDAIVYNSPLLASIISIFTPLVIGCAVSSGYIIKRNKDHKKVFRKLNSQLGEDALEDEYKNFEDAEKEEQKLSELIETQIKKISLIKFQQQENERYLNELIIEEKKTNETKKQNKPNSPSDNLERNNNKTKINEPTSFSNKVYSFNYYTSPKDIEEIQEQSSTLVKKRKRTNS